MMASQLMVISETQLCTNDYGPHITPLVTSSKNDMLCCTAVYDGIPTDGDQQESVHSAGQ